jgi:hypothetical protein
MVNSFVTLIEVARRAVALCEGLRITRIVQNIFTHILWHLPAVGGFVVTHWLTKHLTSSADF